MVKERISATIDKKTAEALKNLMKTGKYRNKSHIIEYAIRLLQEEGK